MNTKLIQTLYDKLNQIIQDSNFLGEDNKNYKCLRIELDKMDDGYTACVLWWFKNKKTKDIIQSFIDLKFDETNNTVGFRFFNASSDIFDIDYALAWKIDEELTEKEFVTILNEAIMKFKETYK